MADHRYPVRPSEVYGAALEVARRLGVAGLPEGGTPAGRFAADLDPIIRDLQANAGQSIVIAGDHHGPELHRVVALINERLNNVRRTVRYVAPIAITYSPLE
ncbi:MAG: hypothetical protein C4320_09980, partial [Armatimonadota bacterium]